MPFASIPMQRSSPAQQGKVPDRERIMPCVGKDDVKESLRRWPTLSEHSWDLLGSSCVRKPRRWRDASNKALGKEISLWDAAGDEELEAIAFINGPSGRTYRYDQRLPRAPMKKHRV